MTDSENQHLPDKPQRSFVVSDFSVREIPFMLLAFIIISVVSVVLGLFVEALPSFWRGYMCGIFSTILAVAILRQVLSTKPGETK